MAPTAILVQYAWGWGLYDDRTRRTLATFSPDFTEAMPRAYCRGRGFRLAVVWRMGPGCTA